MSIHVNTMLSAFPITPRSSFYDKYRDRTTTVMLTIWKSLIRCKLEYCCPLWNPHKLEDIRAIEDVQRFFTRYVCGLQDTDYWGRLKALRLQSLLRRRERYIIIHVRKLLHNKVPNDIGMEFSYNERLGRRAKLQKLYGRAKTSSKTLYDASFAFTGPNLWNAIPKAANTQDKLESFKVHLGKFLDTIPDCPPTAGYTAANNNSIIDWLNQPGGLREKKWTAL